MLNYLAYIYYKQYKRRHAQCLHLLKPAITVNGERNEIYIDDDDNGGFDLDLKYRVNTSNTLRLYE
jgi:hypothetical protein